MSELHLKDDEPEVVLAKETRAVDAVEASHYESLWDRERQASKAGTDRSNYQRWAAGHD